MKNILGWVVATILGFILLQQSCNDKDVSVEVGEEISGTVVELQSRGALVKVQGVNAFLPIGEIQTENVQEVGQVLKLEQVINGVITALDKQMWKMTISIKQLVEGKERAEFEFTTHFRDTHYLWLLDNTTSIEQIKKEFESLENIYIADGHHRSASSFLLSEDLKSDNDAHTGNETYNFFMSYLIPESNLKIHEFNRLVKDLNGLTKDAFLIKLDAIFRIENRGPELYIPSRKHHFSMYLDGEFYSLYLRKHNYSLDNPLVALDTQILYKTVLEPILGISDVRNNTRIDYSHGKNDLINIKSKVDKGEYVVGFGLVPISISLASKIPSLSVSCLLESVP